MEDQPGALPLPLKTDDVWLLSRAWSTPAGFVRGAEFVFRMLGGAVRGKRLVGTGAGLACAFLMSWSRSSARRCG